VSTADLKLPRTRRGGVAPERRDGCLILQGEAVWILEGSTAALDAVAKALPGVCDRLAEELLLLDFGNSVGLFDVPGLGRVEVVSGKWDERHYDRMLGDLTEVACALPFGAGSAGALPYDRSVATRQDVLYHAFVYLRYVLSDHAPPGRQLLPMLRLILKEPHRRLDRVRHQVPPELARRIDAAGLVKIAAGYGRPIPVSAGAAAQSPLARALRGHLPTSVEEGLVRTTHDTPENRFVKTFLRQATGLIEGMRRVVRERPGRSAFQERILGDCDRLERALRPIAGHRFWDEVGRMIQLPASSTVLQRRRGYREVFGHFSRLRLATRVPFDRDWVRDLLEVKDIAELYELWCYFSLVGAVERLLGPPSSAGRLTAGDLSVTLPRTFAVGWSDGTRLIYNATFSRSRGVARRSYSVPLRPDIALEVRQGANAGVHLFDAKFRLDRLETLLAADGSDETPDLVTEERRGTFRRGDIYKMHAYRDAIRGARSVWVLYPGTEFCFFSADAEATLADASGLTALDGVGAVPMTPNTDHHRELEAVLERICTATPGFPFAPHA
jgi:hypothetical protein